MAAPRKDEGCTDAGECRRRIVFAFLVLLGLAARVFVAVLPGNAAEPPWSGGGDAQNYITLARNLAAGENVHVQRNACLEFRIAEHLLHHQGGIDGATPGLQHDADIFG